MKSGPSLPVSRRQFLGMAAAASSTALLSSAKADAISTAVSSKPLGVYSTSLGSYKITALLDGTIPLHREYFSGDDAKIDSILNGIGLTEGIIPAPISAFLLQSTDKNILIDAGMGAISALGSGYGHISSALESVGVSPNQIDTLIVTHAHPDHIGGLLSAEGEAIFPEAEIVISEKEIQFWGDKATLAQAPESSKWLFEYAQSVFKKYSKHITQVTSGKEVLPGIVMEEAPGHTPGHSILHIDGGEKSIVMVADLLHDTELYTALPTVGFGFDVDSQQAALTRIKLFDQLSVDKSIILGSHIHFPGFGKILKSGSEYRYISTTL